MNTVVLISDTTMLPGTHATLTSLLKHCSDDRLSIILFHDNISIPEQWLLWLTFNANSKPGQSIDFRPLGQIDIKKANSLHGNLTTHGRSFLGELLPEHDKVLYLDCDLIVRYDVVKIFDAINDDKTLFVNGTAKRKHALDNDILYDAGLDITGNCFNAGVLGINLKRWRKFNYMARTRQMMDKYQGQMKSANQTVLNIICGNDFLVLGRQINYPVYADTPLIQKDAILHFVGSPKPWDLFGNKLHGNYELWLQYYSLSAIAAFSPFKYASFKRTFNIKESYFRIIKNKLAKYFQTKPSPTLTAE